MARPALALLCLSSLLSLAAVAHSSDERGTNFFVDANRGSAPRHGPAGSADNPFSTIADAVQAAHALDVPGQRSRPVSIVVRPGTYTEPVVIDREHTALIGQSGVDLASGISVFASDVEVRSLQMEGTGFVQSPGYGSGQPYKMVQDVVFEDIDASAGSFFFIGASVALRSSVTNNVGGSGADTTRSGARPVIEISDSVLQGPSGNAVAIFQAFEQIDDSSSGEFSLRLFRNRLSGALTDPPDRLVSDGHLVQIAGRLGPLGRTAFDVEMIDNDLGSSQGAPIFFIGGAGTGEGFSAVGTWLLAGNRFTGPRKLTAIFDYGEWKDVATGTGDTDPWIWNGLLAIDDRDGLLGAKMPPPSQIPPPTPTVAQRAPCDYLAPKSPAFCVDLGPAAHHNHLLIIR